MRRELQGSAVLMQPLILDLNFWHRSFLTTIMVDHYPLLSLHAAKKNLSCSCSFAPSPRHQYPRCFHSIQLEGESGSRPPGYVGCIAVHSPCSTILQHTTAKRNLQLGRLSNSFFKSFFVSSASSYLLVAL